MVEISLANLAAYCGQILIVVSLAVIAARVLDVPNAGVRLAYWRAVVVLCLALPLLAFAQPSAPVLSTPAVSLAPAIIETIAAVTDTSSAATVSPLPIGTFVFALLLTGIWIRGAWLAMGYARLQRVRRHAPVVALDDEMERLRAEIASHTEIRRLIGPGQPATFGFWRPVILLPDSVALMSTAERLAIVCHELVHVRRHDWVWTMAEEMLRTVFWFHPAMRYAISRVQASREEVVDTEVIARTGARHEYMRALMAFAAQPELATATSFVRRSQLKTRMRRIAEEVYMSRPRLRLVASTLCAVLVAAVAVAGAGLRYDVAAEQQFANDAVPLNSVQFSVPVSRAIVRMDRPVYPPAAWRAGIGAEVSFWTLIAPDGRVTIAGPPSWQIMAMDTSPVEAVQEFWSREGWREFVESVSNAVAQWQYVPADSQVMVRSRVTFATPPRRRLSTGIEPGPTSPLPPIQVGVGGAVPPPRRISGASPVYSPYALAAQVEGVVMLEVLVGIDGAVHDVRVLTSIPLLDGSAIDAVAQWRFEPTVVDGVPRDVLITAAVNFSLQ